MGKKLSFVEFAFKNANELWSVEELKKKYEEYVGRAMSINEWAFKHDIDLDGINNGAIIVQHLDEGISTALRGNKMFLTQAVFAIIASLYELEEFTYGFKENLSDKEYKRLDDILKLALFGYLFPLEKNENIEEDEDEEEPLTTLADLIRDERVGRGLTQYKFAQACGLSNSIISVIELGERKVFKNSTYEKLEDYLGFKIPENIRKTSVYTRKGGK